MSTAAQQSPKSSEISVGDELPTFSLELTSTMVIAGAIASRDFMPAHHDPEFAKSRGAPDIFLNIMSTNGYCSRYITDWAGPEAMVRNIKIRLGSPAVPGQPLVFTGQVSQKREEGGECILEVNVQANNELGNHLNGTVEVSLPL